MSKLKFTSSILPLATLIFSTKFQPRAELNKEALADYTEQAKQAKEKGADSPFPALRAIKRNGETIVFSGFHRGNALKKAGFEETKIDLAESEEITDSDIFALAIADNAEHGVRLTNADKEHNLERALKFPENKELSNNALANLVGVSEFFVRQHRPVSASPTTRTAVSKSGKKTKVKVAGIGKKGGKKKPASKKKDAETADLDKELGDDKGKSFDAEAGKALVRICALLDGHNGFTGKGIRESVENGSLKLSGPDLKAWAQSSDLRVKAIAELVVNNGWSPKKAYAFIDKEIDSHTKVEHLVNLAIAGGGYNRQNPGSKLEKIGEKVVDHDNYTVLAFDHTKFTVTVEAK